MDRRQMLRSSLAMAGLCCTSEEAPAGSFRIEGSSLMLDMVPQLRRSGGAVKVVDLERKINLIVVSAGKGRFAALERSCTHGGAQVSYNEYNKTVQCTSWGHSEFALDGTVLGGSAKKPLKSYEVRRRGERLEIAGVVA